MKLELQSLSARHPAARVGAPAAIREVNLHIAPGERVALIGPSGAGKTTLLQVLACALPPTAGHLQLDDRSPWQLPRHALQRLRGRLFLAPQVPPLPPRQRVVTAVLAGRLPRLGLLASLRSLLYPADLPGAHDVLTRFDLTDKLFDRVDRLSGGERQRVGLARALLALQPLPGTATDSGARLLLVDEPLSALDPARSRQAIAALISAAEAHHTTLVATLHQVDVALNHFPRIVGLRDGAVAFDLPAHAVTRDHLARLYDQHEHELRGDVPPTSASGSTDWAPRPVPLQCR